MEGGAKSEQAAYTSGMESKRKDGFGRKKRNKRVELGWEDGQMNFSDLPSDPKRMRLRSTFRKTKEKWKGAQEKKDMARDSGYDKRTKRKFQDEDRREWNATPIKNSEMYLVEWFSVWSSENEYMRSYRRCFFFRASNTG